MKTKEEKSRELFSKLKQEYKRRGRRYIYNIIHQMNIVHEDNYIVTTYSPRTMSCIIAYIEHIAWEVTHDCGHSLHEKEVIELINEFYTEVEKIDKPYKSYYEIEMYDNWETYAGYDFENEMKDQYYREGLLEYIKEMSIRNNWKQVS